jgi:phage FluMu protein Com
MDIRFNCPHCNQTLTVEERGAGTTVNCPSCKKKIEIPRATAAPPPPLPAEPKAMQQSQTRQPQKQTSFWTCGTMAGFAVLGLIAVVVALVLWFAYNSSKPKLFANVEVIRDMTLRVTNANDTAWNSPTIILNELLQSGRNL